MAKVSKYGRFETINNVCLNDFPMLKVSPSARLIWLILWRNASSEGKVSISLSRLQVETGLARTTCIKRLGELIEKELVRVDWKGNRNGKVSRYSIIVYEAKPRKVVSSKNQS